MSSGISSIDFGIDSQIQDIWTTNYTTMGPSTSSNPNGNRGLPPAGSFNEIPQVFSEYAQMGSYPIQPGAYTTTSSDRSERQENESYEESLKRKKFKHFNRSQFRRGSIETRVYCADCPRVYSLNEAQACPDCKSDNFKIKPEHSKELTFSMKEVMDHVGLHNHSEEEDNTRGSNRANAILRASYPTIGPNFINGSF